MKIKSIICILIIIVLLTVFSGCTQKDEDIVVGDIVTEDIIVEAGTYEYSYFDKFNGNEITYTKETKEASLPVILNDWISDIIQQKANYGNTPKGNSILEDLEVKAAYFEKNTIIIVMNEAFINFNNGYSNPVDFINGLRNILSQVTDASEFSIEAEGYNNSIIHPDGVTIKNIIIKTK